MKKHLITSVLTVMVGLGLVVAIQASEEEAYKIGDEVKSFSLKDASGQEHDLGKYLGEDVVVLEFWNMHCPVSNAYMERMKELHSKYDEKGVTFFAIDSNSTNDVEAIKAFAQKHEMQYPVLKDLENKIADKFGATRTPELIVIGKDKKIQYHGAIDDSQNPDKVENHYLKNAIAAVLKGEKPAVQETKAFGCTIKKIDS